LKIHFPPETGSFPSENRHSNRGQGTRPGCGTECGRRRRNRARAGSPVWGAGRTAGARYGARPPVKEPRARGAAGAGRRAHGWGSKWRVGPPARSAAASEGVRRTRGRRCGKRPCTGPPAWSAAAREAAGGAAGTGTERGRARSHRRSALARGSAGIRPSWAENTLFPADFASLT
jgi:hypothetical protein